MADQKTIYDTMKNRLDEDARKRIEDMNIQAYEANLPEIRRGMPPRVGTRFGPAMSEDTKAKVADLAQRAGEMLLGLTPTTVSGEQEEAEIKRFVDRQRQKQATDDLAGPDFLTTDEDVELLNRAQIRKMDSEIPIRLPPTDTDVLEPNRVRLRRMN